MEAAMRVESMLILGLALAGAGCRAARSESSNLNEVTSPTLGDSLFEIAAKGIVACREAVGDAFPQYYDETGACGDGGSIWDRGSENPTIRAPYFLASGDGDGRAFHKVYKGHVSFVDEQGRACQFELKVMATDEEASAQVEKFTCEGDAPTQGG
jgi:hypothetical protein